MVLFFKKELLAFLSKPETPAPRCDAVVITTTVQASVEAITTEAGLRGLAPAWQDLWRRTPDTTPFQYPEWQLAWWRQFGTGRPVVATLRDGGLLVGLLPAYVLEEDGRAKLLPIGAGISDSLDALVAPNAPPDTAARLLACLLAEAGPAECCDLIDLPPASALRHAPPPPGWVATLYPGAPCPVLRLPNGDFAASLPPNARRKLRMNRNRAERAGGWSLQLADADTLPDLLAALFGLHEAGWAQRGEPGGVLADVRVKACLTEAAPGLLRAGALRVAALRIGPEVAAACMALRGPDRLLLYLGGFSAGHAACSPGSLLVAALAEQAIAEGVQEIDFLRGNEAYKYAWGASDRHLATRSLRRL